MENALRLGDLHIEDQAEDPAPLGGSNIEDQVNQASLTDDDLNTNYVNCLFRFYSKQELPSFESTVWRCCESYYVSDKLKVIFKYSYTISYIVMFIIQNAPERTKKNTVSMTEK